MSELRALAAERIFDGYRFHSDAAIVIEDGHVVAITDIDGLPAGVRPDGFRHLLLVPGFVDWQVNGGGGVLFNETPTPQALEKIALAHRQYGTTALLPTVITDAYEVTEAAANAAREAIAATVPGIVGIHFEGPHLSHEKRGVHDPAFIRPMEASDVALVSGSGLGRVVATVAPENTTLEQISELSRSGVIVSIGHTNADYKTACAAFAAGAKAVTHLFNAMAPLHHREPGLIGAATENREIWCGLIADGHHVHAAVLKMIFRAGPTDRLTLVTDAMSSVGSADDCFTLNGRTVRRQDGRLTIADGTLAGSDLNMRQAVKYAVDQCGVPLHAALQMAARNPADMLDLPTHGRLTPGARADILSLDRDLAIGSVWMGGKEVG